MRRIVGVVLVCLAVAGCGGDGDSKKAAAAAARQLDPGSELVAAVDVDYGDANWQQVKRLYARAVQQGGIDFGEITPPTLDGALTALASSAGLSFADDVRPLLKGTLLIGVDIEPAPPLSVRSRRILERVDRTRSGYDRAGEIYYDRQGHRIRDVSRRRIQRALDEQSSREPKYEFTAVFRTADPKALRKVLGKLRDQGLEAEPMPGVKGAKRLASWLALVGQDTLVGALGPGGDDDSSERLLRERLAGAGKGPAVPQLGDDFLALRVTPQLLGAWLDRDELSRALASAPGKALRGAQARVRLDRAAGQATARVDFEGLEDDALPLPGPGGLALPRGQGIASASANQSLTTVFLARLARELWPDSRFVRRVERLERKQGLRFEDEVLRQFSGPSFTITRPRRDGGVDFAARSTLRDPAAMAQLLAAPVSGAAGHPRGASGPRRHRADRAAARRARRAARAGRAAGAPDRPARGASPRAARREPQRHRPGPDRLRRARGRLRGRVVTEARAGDRTDADRPGCEGRHPPPGRRAQAARHVRAGGREGAARTLASRGRERLGAGR